MKFSLIVLTLVIIYIVYHRSGTNSNSGSNSKPNPVIPINPSGGIIPAPKPDPNCIMKDRIRKQDSTGIILEVQNLRMNGWGLQGPKNGAAEVGFCGETAYKSVMLYHGNYVSERAVWVAAGNAQLLLGLNDDVTSNYFNMNFLQWSGVEIADVLAFIKKYISKYLPVIAGVFSFEFGGDPSFDHTIPFIGYTLDSSGTNIKNIIYNDVYMLNQLTLDCSVDPNTKIPVCFRTREQCAPKANERQRQPWIQCIPDVRNVCDPPGNPPGPMKNGVCPPGGSPAQVCLLTLLGNKDENNELFPVSIILDAFNVDEPDNSMEEDGQNWNPRQLGCIVKVSCLVPGGNYSLLRFDDPKLLPSKDFLSSKNFKWRKDFTAEGPNFNLVLGSDPTFLSNGTYFFRCVSNTSGVIVNIPQTINMTNLSTIKPAFDISTCLIKTGVSGLMTSNDTDNVCASKTKKGTVHPYWIWSFPGNPKDKKQDPLNDPTQPDLGCLLLLLTAGKASQGTLMQNCLWFDAIVVDQKDGTFTTDISSNILDYDGNEFGDGSGSSPSETNGTIDMNGFPYFDNISSYYFCAYPISFDPSSGTYTMMSENGETISYLTPINDPTAN
jgi:hypothetical protein